MFFERRENLFIGRFAELFLNQVVFHGFSTRKGGVSDSSYHSLNLGSRTGDAPSRVAENRRRFFHSIGIRKQNLALPQQVHGDRVERVAKPGRYENTDGLVTNVRGIVLTIQVADCLPVFLYDPLRNAVGLVHAGWRSTELGIVSKGVAKMAHHFQTNPTDLWVFFGPSIGPCCYEIGPEAARRFSAKYISQGRLDLWQCNRDQLLDAGVLPHKIEMSCLCTVCRPEWFFSHRASGGRTGRMMAVIGLRDKKRSFQ